MIYFQNLTDLNYIVLYYERVTMHVVTSYITVCRIRYSMSYKICNNHVIISPPLQVFAFLEAGEADLLAMCIMSGQMYPERIAFQMLQDLVAFIRDAADADVRRAKENGMNAILMETMGVLARK